MSRRASLPGAAELFRSTSAVPADAAEDALAGSVAVADPAQLTAPAQPRRPVSVVRDAESGPAQGRDASGRQRHDEKITVYCSAHELLELESARLTLRAEHGIAVDRGRIVREALAVVLADLEANGPESMLVGRLRRP